jgi:serine/threonine-protein kinase RsbW
MTEGPVSLTIDSDIEEIPRVSDLLEDTLKNHGFPDEDILDTQLAVEEVVTNVIMHGYGETGGEILISCLAGPDTAVIRIEDRAAPFDPLSLPEPDIDADILERQIGGLGIFLTRQVMDDVRYHFEDGKNILELIKKRSG